MRIYIAGPMTSYENLNFPLFHSEAARIRALGHEVVNPAEINTDPNAIWHECMRADITEMVKCEAIALLPNWFKSRGAKLEHHIADALGLAVFLAAEVVS